MAMVVCVALADVRCVSSKIGVPVAEQGGDGLGRCKMGALGEAGFRSGVW